MQASQEVAVLYRGAGGALWDRIEGERPASYLEHNLVDGRRREQALLLDWLQERPEEPRDVPEAGPAAPGRVLDAGCGRGALALAMAEAGVEVVAVDRVPRFSSQLRRGVGAGRLASVVGDLGDLLQLPEDSQPWEAVVLREVLQDYSREEREALLQGLCHGSARRLLITLRRETRWTPLARELWPPGLAGVVDPAPLLRWLHLETPYRLVRQQEVRRRNFRSLVAELHRQPVFPSPSSPSASASTGR